MKKRREDCKYCGEKLTDGNTKKEFCCDLHRVYWHRENPKVKVQDLTKPTNVIKSPEPPKTNFIINTTKEVAPKETGLTAFQIYQRKKMGLK